MRSRFPGPAATTLAALLLVACATPAERELHKVSLASEKLWAEYDVCMTRVEGTTAHQRLSRAYILTRDDPRSVEKMAIERLASDRERADLLQNQKNESRCNQELFKGFAEINPGFNVLLARFMSEDDELVLQTIQGEITVGSRNRIVQQRYAQRLRDWNFAGERLVRLHTWRLRRTCSVHCSSFSAALLLPTSTAGTSNLASVTPLPPAAGQEAGLPQVGASPDSAGPAAQLATAPAAATPPQVQPSAQAAGAQPEISTAPAVEKPKTAPEPTALAPSVIPLPGAPKPEAAAEAAADTRVALAPAGEATKSAPAIKPSATAEKSKSSEASPEQTTGQKPARTGAPAPRQAKTPAKSGTRATASALKPPTPDTETGLKPAAGPEIAPKAQKKRPAQIASTAKTAMRPVYTVHLASTGSEVEARAEWGKLQARYPAILGDRVLFTREVTVGGKGTYVRVLTGLFHDRAQAKALCGSLGGGAQYCAIMQL